MTKLSELKAAYEAANVVITDDDPEEFRATNCDVAHKQVPFTMYETVYTYRGDVLRSGEVKPITVTRYGINHAVEATAPSITFTSWDGHTALGSLDMFYERKEWAQAEVDKYVAEAQRTEANAQFIALAHNAMPMLLEAVELLETASARVRLANDEGNPILSAWLTDANRLLGKLEGHRGELK